MQKRSYELAGKYYIKYTRDGWYEGAGRVLSKIGPDLYLIESWAGYSEAEYTFFLTARMTISSSQMDNWRWFDSNSVEEWKEANTDGYFFHQQRPHSEFPPKDPTYPGL